MVEMSQIVWKLKSLGGPQDNIYIYIYIKRQLRWSGKSMVQEVTDAQISLFGDALAGETDRSFRVTLKRFKFLFFSPLAATKQLSICEKKKYVYKKLVN